MKQVGRYGIGPYYGDPLYATNWMRQVYKHDTGFTVYIDRQHRPRKWFEVFVPTDGGLWCIGEFYPSPQTGVRNWADAERKAEWMVDQWIGERKPDDQKAAMSQMPTA